MYRSGLRYSRSQLLVVLREAPFRGRPAIQSRGIVLIPGPYLKAKQTIVKYVHKYRMISEARQGL